MRDGKFSAQLDNKLKEHLNKSSVFTGTSKIIQNVIVVVKGNGACQLQSSLAPIQNMEIKNLVIVKQ